MSFITNSDALTRSTATYTTMRIFKLSNKAKETNLYNWKEETILN